MDVPRLLPLVAVPLLIAAALPAGAQDSREGRIVRRVEFEGLQTISDGFVRALIQTRTGQPFSTPVAERDVNELLKSRKFLGARAATRIEGDGVVVIFQVREKPIVQSLEVLGNEEVETDDLLDALGFSAGEPRDEFLISRGRDALLRIYRERGYYYATIELDQTALESDRVVYRISEGPRVRVRDIEFEGNRAFPTPQLRSKIATSTYLWVFRKGALDEERAEQDAITLQQFYRNDGFLDARVGYRLEFDEAERSDLRVVFVIEEGARYRVSGIEVDGNEVYSDQRVREVMELMPGNIIREDRLRRDVQNVRDLYGTAGYIDAQINATLAFAEEEAVATIRVGIVENQQSRVGRVTIRGNEYTKDEVVRREVALTPGELYDSGKVRESERNIRETTLFSRASITPLPESGGLREALVEVEEAQTVNILFGIGVSTDNGAIGSVTIDNRNFDLFDWPRSWEEFLRGQAFRGDGQRLNIRLAPGTELSQFRINFTEPYLFDKPLRLDIAAYLFERPREGWDEERLGFNVTLGKRFEGGALDGWALEGSLRFEQVEVDDLDALVPSDVRDERGDNFLTSMRAGLIRDTTDSRVFPTSGYRFSLGWEQVGALGGDYDFGRPAAGITWYKTVRTDVLDRKHVLALRADASFIVGDAPIFEGFFGGGFGSLRGFTFRGVSPRRGILDTPVGGDFILLTGAEYSFPLYGDSVRGVTFLDMGTVEEDFEITDWRASVGFGFRVKLDFFGPVPLVFDFGFPISENDQDENRVFNFSFGASF